MTEKMLKDMIELFGEKTLLSDAVQKYKKLNLEVKLNE